MKTDTMNTSITRAEHSDLVGHLTDSADGDGDDSREMLLTHVVSRCENWGFPVLSYLTLLEIQFYDCTNTTDGQKATPSHTNNATSTTKLCNLTRPIDANPQETLHTERHKLYPNAHKTNKTPNTPTKHHTNTKNHNPSQ